ncbi:MAG: acetate--CoA ligase family protein [Candidatus Hodarchaeales archaeon]|jgi:acetyl-CoA synthetase (ADP-forming)
MNLPSKTIKTFLAQGKEILTVFESKQLLKEAGFPVNRFGLATEPEQAVTLAEELGFPLVLKIVSSDIVHKSDIGGVVVGVESIEKVRSAFDDLMANVRDVQPEAKVDGVLVEEMVQDGGTEVILGTVIDPVFEHVLMFGLGGIFVEVLKDVTFRLIPMSQRDAEEMLEEIKAATVLDGVRGQPPANKRELANLIMKLSDLVATNKEIAECDLNPVFAGSKKAIVVDARLVLKPWQSKSKK